MIQVERLLVRGRLIGICSLIMLAIFFGSSYLLPDFKGPILLVSFFCIYFQICICACISLFRSTIFFLLAVYW